MEGYSTLQILQMGKNHISILHDDAFQSMTNVHTLLLNSNAISYIASHAFRGLDRLKRLSLESNEITQIDLGDLPSGAFVELHGNPMKSLEGLCGLPEAPVYMYRRRVDIHGETQYAPKSL